MVVVVVASPPPKVASKPVVKIEAGETVVAVEAEAPPEPPETFTVGVTDYTFNSINAIFGRLLKTPDGMWLRLLIGTRRKR